MTGIPSERAGDARAALRVIVSDPGHGPAALSNPRAISNLLKDLLPDAPREKNLLVAAAEASLAAMISDHIAQGIDAGSAIRLAAAAFGATTHFTDSACLWVATELAIALRLAPGLADSPSELADGDLAAPDLTAPDLTPPDLTPPDLAETGQPGQPAPVTAPLAEAAGAQAAPHATQVLAGDTREGPPPASQEPARVAARRPRQPVTAGAALVVTGTLALLAACWIPVFYSPYPARIWGNGQSDSWFITSGPTTALAITALCGALLCFARAARVRLAVAGAALACGVQVLLMYLAIYWQQVRDYGNELGSGILLAVFSTVLLVAGGALELRRQRAAERIGATSPGAAGS